MSGWTQAEVDELRRRVAVLVLRVRQELHAQAEADVESARVAFVAGYRTAVEHDRHADDVRELGG